LVARRFLLDATEAVVSRDDLSVRRGLLLADVAAEALLKLALRSFEVAINEQSRFGALLSDLEAAGKTRDLKLAYARQPLQRLRTMRNAVMHESIAQGPSTARGVVAGARQVLARLVAEVFERDLENLRLDDFVKSPWIRLILKEAANHFEAKRYMEAATLAASAFRQLMGMWNSFVEDLLDHGVAQKNDGNRVHAILSSGVYLPDLKRFREATDGAFAQISVNGTTSFAYTKSRWHALGERELADARFALDFVGGLALQIEGRFDDELPAAFAAQAPERLK